MFIIVDVYGLAPHAPEDTRWALAEQIEGASVMLETPSLEWLAQLKDGIGVRIVTGPLGKDFWAPVSEDVQIHVYPDNYDWKDRYGGWTWALVQAGVVLGEARTMARSIDRGKFPTKKHKHYSKIAAAQSLLDQLSDTDPEPLQIETEPFDIMGVDDGLAYLAGITEKAALDGEWHRETKIPVGLSVSTGGANRYLPLRASDVDNLHRVGDVRAGFSEFCVDGRRPVLHNGRSDLQTFFRGDYHRVDIDDTSVIAYLMGETNLKLKPLSRKFLNRDPIENDREWWDEPVKRTARYAAAGDTRNTLDLYNVLYERLKQYPGQLRVYEEIERPLIPLIALMEKVGTPVDMGRVIEAYREHVTIEYGLRRSILDNYGYDLSDDKQTLQFIVSCGYSNPGTLDQRVISLIDHWCIDLILAYRQTRTRRRSFLKGLIKRWLDDGKPDDFRVYPRFNQAGSMDGGKTAPRTGRLSSADPNLQNQPRTLRDIYVPPKGYKWWSYDYSGLELHIAAAMSGDPEMCKYLDKLHDRFRAFIQEETGTDVGRPAAKQGNFEQLYEGGPGELVRLLAKQRAFISFATAQVIVDSHHKLFSGYHGHGAAIAAQARIRGYAETLDGRIRWIEEYKSSDPKVISHGDRAAQNHEIQGTAADIVKKAMLRLWPVLRRYGAHMALQVHDELDGWVPEDADLEAFDRDVRAVLEDVWLPNGIRLKVSGGVGNDWSEAH